MLSVYFSYYTVVMLMYDKRLVNSLLIVVNSFLSFLILSYTIILLYKHMVNVFLDNFQLIIYILIVSQILHSKIYDHGLNTFSKGTNANMLVKTK